MGTPLSALSQTILGRPVPEEAQALRGLFVATVAAALPDNQANVTIDGFDPTNQATYLATFEPRFGSGGTAKTPPVGTKCLVAFTTRIAYALQQNGQAAPNVGAPVVVWIVAFQDWPT